MSFWSSIGNFVGKAANGLTGGLLSAAGGVASSLIGASSQRSANNANIRLAQMNNEANMELAKYSYSQQLEQWKRQNEYNTPSAQMQRYADAGLNPNLIYGQGSNGNAASSPAFQAIPNQAASVSPVNRSGVATAIGNMLSTYNNLRMQNAQIEQAQAQAQKARADASLVSTRQSVESIMAKYAPEIAWLNWDSEYHRNTILRHTVDPQIRGAHLANETAAQKLDNMQQEYNLMRAQLESLQFDNAFKKSTAYKEFVLNMAVKRKQIEHMISQIGVNEETAYNLQQDWTGKSIRNSMLLREDQLDQLSKGLDLGYLSWLKSRMGSGYNKTIYNLYRGFKDTGIGNSASILFKFL